MNFIIKVDCDFKQEIVIPLIEAGVNSFCFQYSDIKRFSAVELNGRLDELHLRDNPQIEYGIEYGYDDLWNIDPMIISILNPKFNQYPNNLYSIEEESHYPYLLGKTTILSDIVISHDDDPTWIVPNEFRTASNTFLYQATLFPEFDDPWDFITQKCPEIPELYQITDLIRLTENNPTILTTRFSQRNILQILDTIKDLNGIWFSNRANLTNSDRIEFNLPEIIHFASLARGFHK